MRLVPTGRTIAQEWDAADNAQRGKCLQSLRSASWYIRRGMTRAWRLPAWRSARTDLR